MEDTSTVRLGALTLLSPIAEHAPSPPVSKPQRDREFTADSSRLLTPSQVSPFRLDRSPYGSLSNRAPRHGTSGAQVRPVSLLTRCRQSPADI